ncbi:uncharacterized protein [Fopius arisanus]|uniref:J domain-containing protein n=1 Tax=Fopius arisanus TaxID=64838 RepID=A0A9R1U7V7_9HYME|nr:PREDICTED: uncharacterized protein LOC105270984 [Fopius arisanus]
MADRQQPPPDYKRMSLDKIIEAMTADLEGPSGHYVQFGIPPSQPPLSTNWSDYPSEPIHPHPPPAPLPASHPQIPLQPPIYLPEAFDTPSGELIYFPPQTVNHLGITENNDLVGTIDVGNGNFINVIYGNASQIVPEDVPSMSPYSNHQMMDREYGLFDQRGHHNLQNSTTNGKQLIDNLVGNWVPNQSGTYSPFGGSPNVTPVPHASPEVEEVPKVMETQKKPRMVAEVKPMRPSYSSVLTKSAPPPPSPLNAPQSKVQVDSTLKKTSKSSKGSKGKPGVLKRQNSSGSDEHGSPKNEAPKKNEKNNSNLSRRWVSLDNLGGNEGHERNDMNGFSRPDQRKTSKTARKNERNETLNNTKVQSGGKIGGNNQKRPIHINNNLGNEGLGERVEKNIQIATKGKEEKKKDKGAKRFHPEKEKVLKKGKNRKRENRESPVKDLCKNFNKYASRWSKIGLKVFYWLLHLITDVVSMSTNLVIQFVKCMWFHTVLYLKYSWAYVSTTVAKIRFLNAIGKRIDDKFGNSRFAFWRRLKSKRKEEKDDNVHWLQGGLEANIALPSTGEEAMKRLLACKGKDPYSILGVTPTCSDDDIKKYYKRQAFLVHPDKNSQPGAEEAFKILVHAFDIIGEPERRQAFDQTRQVEAAWGELSDLLSQLHRKMEQAANTIRCTNCGLRHKRVPTQRPCYAARFCAQCKIRHSAKEGDIWAESRVMGFLWHYYACMEGAVYDVTDWAACQAGNLKHLRANTHNVQYRIVLGQRPPPQGATGKKRQHVDGSATDADLEDFLNNLYNHSKTGGATATTEQPISKDSRRRKAKRK